MRPVAPSTRLALATSVAMLAGLGLAWALSAAEPAPAVVVRALADGLGAAVLGLTTLPWLLAGTVRHWELPWRTVTVLAASWSLSEAALVIAAAADAAGVSTVRLGLHSFTDYLATASGQVSIAAVLCALAVSGYSLRGFRSGERAWPAGPALALSAAAITLRPIIGHMSQQPMGSMLGAVHALAASAWFGLLAALALTLRSRAQWSAALPRYSGAALPLVSVLAITGLANALVRVGGLPALLTTGYGRIAAAKALIVVVAVALGWWWRRTWVAQAARHQVGPEVSLRRSVVETSLLAVAFGLAASLAVTA